jgi:hypothetical protein
LPKECVREKPTAHTETTRANRPAGPAAAGRLAPEFLDRVWHPPRDLSGIDEFMTEDQVIDTDNVLSPCRRLRRVENPSPDRIRH